MAFRLRWPTQFNLITQHFLARPEVYREFFYTGFDGNRHRLPGHEGIDFHATDGSKIFACADGEVVRVSLDEHKPPKDFPYGNQIRLKHITPEGEFESVYAHLMRVLVSVGDQVRAGEEIALADNTGNSEGSHLHLTLKKRGASLRGETIFMNDVIDPSPFLDPFVGTTPLIRRDSVIFVADLTIPDGTVMPPGNVFDKTWRVRNNGESTWTRDYQLAFSSGERMGAPDSPLPATVQPGEFIDLTVRLTAPLTPGRYRSTWRLSNDASRFFGQTVFAEIRVEG
jgi:murein DD-endopeptidase MepM/ murein hydrolase activator NlpD